MTEKQVLFCGVSALWLLVVVLSVCLALSGATIDNLQETNALLRAEIRGYREAENRTVKVIPEVEPEEQSAAIAVTDEPAWKTLDVPWNTIHNCTVTAYCPCGKCCGRWADGLTASGATPAEGVTVAVDTSVIPMGAEVRFEGDDTIYVAQDTGVAGSHIDRYFNDHAEAEDFGVQYKTVYWRYRT